MRVRAIKTGLSPTAVSLPIIPVFNANSVDPDQTPRFAASDLGLHCLPVSFLWDTTHKWVKGNGYIFSVDISVKRVLFPVKRDLQNKGSSCSHRRGLMGRKAHHENTPI